MLPVMVPTSHRAGLSLVAPAELARKAGERGLPGCTHVLVSLPCSDLRGYWHSYGNRQW